MTDHVGTIGRGGVVLAMSGGLVATMGLPAQALSKHSAGQDATPATAPLSVGADLLTGAAFMAAPASAAAPATAPLSAPVGATVAFETGSFTAVPQAHLTSSALPASLTSTVGSARGSSVLAIAARYVGVTYRYGGTTPVGWDCSGATRYIYDQLGYTLPRTADEQMHATTRVSRSAARPGDLVFFISGGSAYHVGIYAGGDQMYDAGRTGETFTKRAIFSSAVVFGRVTK